MSKVVKKNGDLDIYFDDIEYNIWYFLIFKALKTSSKIIIANSNLQKTFYFISIGKPWI